MSCYWQVSNKAKNCIPLNKSKGHAIRTNKTKT